MTIEDTVPEDWRRRLSWDALHPGYRAAIAEYGMYCFRLALAGQPTVARIDEIKYDGRLVMLDDGSRWEVDGYDAERHVRFWNLYDLALVADGTMYNINDAETAEVTEE